MLNALLNWAGARLREPSTYAGIAGVVASMTFLPHAQADANAVVTWGSVIASAMTILVPEAPKGS
jgi:hypothetical protein